MRPSRRSFLEKVGLGAGAALLGPIAQGLVSEALGQTPGRKRAIFFLHGNGLHYDWNFTPPEIRARDPKLQAPVLDGGGAFTWPGMLKNLEAQRARMLLVDGLANELPKSQHSGGYGALSCFTAANNAANEYGGPPGNVTIDQFLADKLSAGQPVKSVLYGVTNGSRTVHPVISASGRERAEPHVMSPALLHTTLFGPLFADAGGVRRGAVKEARILEALRGDVKKLQGALAGPERRKLDHYLAAMEEYDRRQKAIGALACKPGAAPGDTSKLTVEDRLELMTEMALLALTCGMTSVVGVSAGCGMSHQMFPGYQRIAAGTMFAAEGKVDGKGHDPREVQGPAMELIHNFHAGLLARMVAALSSIKEGDGTLFDSTVMLYTSDNGEMHHSSKRRWPLVVIGDAGGKLKTGGRFLRYPAKGKEGARSLADFYCSLAHACGVPTDTFGQGGTEPVKGPLPELMG